MANYRRLISYIYAYEGGRKGQNVGFAKLEIRNGQCKIQVNVRNVYIGSKDTGVYLLAGAGEIMLGRIFIRNGAGEFRAMVPVNDVAASGQNMDQCYGLTIHNVDDSWQSYTTIWEDAVTHAAEIDLNEATTQAIEEKEMDNIPASQITPEKIQQVVEHHQKSITEDIEEEIEAQAASSEPCYAETGGAQRGAATLPESAETGGARRGAVTLPESASGIGIQKLSAEIPDLDSGSAANEILAFPKTKESNRVSEPEPWPNREKAMAKPAGVCFENSQSKVAEAAKEPKEPARRPLNQPEEAAEEPKEPVRQPLNQLAESVETPKEPARRPLNQPAEAVKEPEEPAGQPLNQLAETAETPKEPAGQPLNQLVEAAKEPKEPVRQPLNQSAETPEALAGLVGNDADIRDEEPKMSLLWQHFHRSYPKIQAFDYKGGCEILTIKPQDIGLLPREAWVYGNNSFLLHGYYNHRYLILAKLSSPKGKDRYLLGVPGHYYSNEKYMASMFGFPNFVLSKMQPIGDGRFGYWYTDIRLGT